MTELLRAASEALIANDAAVLERLANEVSRHKEAIRPPIVSGSAAQLAAAAEVLRRQVSAASVHLATRRRLIAMSKPQAESWAP